MRFKARLSILGGMTIGDRIAKARALKGLTLDDVAARLGVTRVAVNNWERGENNPTTARLEDIGKVLDVTVEWLTSSEDSEPSGRPKMLDAATWRAVLVSVEHHLRDRGIELTPEDKADYLFICYEIAHGSDNPEKFDPARHPNVIDLVARRRT